MFFFNYYFDCVKKFNLVLLSVPMIWQRISNNITQIDVIYLHLHDLMFIATVAVPHVLW